MVRPVVHCRKVVAVKTSLVRGGMILAFVIGVLVIPDIQPAFATGRCSTERVVKPGRIRYQACIPYFSNTGHQSLTWTDIPEPTQGCGSSRMRGYEFLDLVCTKVTISSMGDVGWVWIANVPRFKSVRSAAGHLAKILSRAGYRCNWDLVEGLGAQLRMYSQRGVSVKRFNKRGPGCAYYKVEFKKQSLFVFEGGECIPREVVRGCFSHHLVTTEAPE